MGTSATVAKKTTTVSTPANCVLRPYPHEKYVRTYTSSDVRASECELAPGMIGMTACRIVLDDDYLSFIAGSKFARSHELVVGHGYISVLNETINSRHNSVIAETETLR